MFVVVTARNPVTKTIMMRAEAAEVPSSSPLLRSKRRNKKKKKKRKKRRRRKGKILFDISEGKNRMKKMRERNMRKIR
jgi:hypothetical protein